MIIKEQKGDVLTSTGLNEVTFSIDSSSEHIIFDILRSKLYKNNIGSICREVACNSRDAMREIGIFNKQIEIEIIDNTANLSFEDGINIIFRDFGIGISPDRAANIYSKYGASTKRDSNVSTGGFGLGAKTPFAYSDAFIVRTVYDNVEYIYSIYIDESKKGKMILLESNSFEMDGCMTEIIIPINSKDVSKFKNEVIKSTQFWKLKPKLIGFGNTSYIQLNEKKYSFSLPKNIQIFSSNEIFESKINVIIDGIIYPVDLNILNINTDINEKICIYFNNGELGISANRENLNYDNDTIEKITDNIKILLESISNEYSKSILEEKSLLHAFQKYLLLKNTDKLFKFSQIYFPKDILYSVDLENKKYHFNLTDKTILEKFDLKVLNLSLVKFDNLTEKYTRFVLNFNDFVSRNTFIKNIKNNYLGDFDILKTNKRLKVGITKKIHNTTGDFYFIHPKSFEDTYKDTYSGDFKKDCADDIWKLKLLGFEIVDNYYDVKPEVIVRTKVITEKYISFKRTNIYEDYKFEFFKVKVVDKKIDFLNKEIVYFEIPDEKTVLQSILNEMTDYKKILSKLGNKNGIFLVPPSKLKYFKNCTKLEDFLVTNKNEILKYLKRNIITNDLYLINSDFSKYFILDDETNKEIDELKQIKKMEKLYFYTNIPLLTKIIGIFDTTDYFKIANKIKNKYPLLKDACAKNLKAQTIIEYIKLINKIK